MDMSQAASLACGKWTGILTHYGVDLSVLNKKHQPCPFCGGKDRFRYIDTKQDGYWFCNQCGHGDGFDFLHNHLGISKAEAKEKVLKITSNVTSAPPPKPDKGRREALVNVLQTAAIPHHSVQLAKYLKTRGIDMDVIGRPKLKMVKGLKYYHEGATDYLYAMLAKVENRHGVLESVHRTYFGVPEGSPKRKMMAPVETITGSAIRLYPATSVVAVAEGIETALAARQLMLKADLDVPVWAAVSAHGLENLMLPDSIKKVYVFGDNDENFTGQASAYALAHSLVKEGREVVITIPTATGDYNDVLLEKII